MPLAVAAGALNVTVSPSASVALTCPATIPLAASGSPAVATATGAVLAGAIATLTGTISDPP